ncbi:Uncharacterized protein HZ326_29766 [Fusarium oxysporum f. sp. albedinis]|nr:Uncharacterized protein HZ326_29766 [Fusarium oxysporum f. sp. albedinis]
MYNDTVLRKTAVAEKESNSGELTALLCSSRRWNHDSRENRVLQHWLPHQRVPGIMQSCSWCGTPYATILAICIVYSPGIHSGMTLPTFDSSVNNAAQMRRCNTATTIT